jgi:hypothetical protein
MKESNSFRALGTLPKADLFLALETTQLIDSFERFLNEVGLWENNWEAVEREILVALRTSENLPTFGAAEGRNSPIPRQNVISISPREESAQSSPRSPTLKRRVDLRQPKVVRLMMLRWRKRELQLAHIHRAYFS